VATASVRTRVLSRRSAVGAREGIAQAFFVPGQKVGVASCARVPPGHPWCAGSRSDNEEASGENSRSFEGRATDEQGNEIAQAIEHSTGTACASQAPLAVARRCPEPGRIVDRRGFWRFDCPSASGRRVHRERLRPSVHLEADQDRGERRCGRRSPPGRAPRGRPHWPRRSRSVGGRC